MPNLFFFLWDISHPMKNGAPTITPTADDEILPSTRKATSTFELAIDFVITKTFKHYDIPLHITDNIRTTFKGKLWRMGRLISKTGGRARKAQLDCWKTGKDATWNMTINETEVKTQLLRKRRITEDKLKNETIKRQKLESHINDLEKTVEKKRIQILNLKLGNDSVPQRA